MALTWHSKRFPKRFSWSEIPLDDRRMIRRWGHDHVGPLVGRSHASEWLETHPAERRTLDGHMFLQASVELKKKNKHGKPNQWFDGKKTMVSYVSCRFPWNPCWEYWWIGAWGGMEDGASFGWCKEVDLENRPSIIPAFHIWHSRGKIAMLNGFSMRSCMVLESSFSMATVC